MKLRAPMYYKNFKCIANKCKNNCCKAGWEIDIDENTSKKYKKIDGNFGKKLKNNICYNTEKHIILNKKGICPFLDNSDLCEIFINLGEENMCQICKDHPRYYEWFGDIKECGIGLCCEEAAKIILSNKEPFSEYEKEIDEEDISDFDKDLYEYLYNARKKIILYLDNNKLNINKKIKNILWYVHTLQQNIDFNLLDEEEIFEIKSEKNNDIKKLLNYFLSFNFNDNNYFLDFKNNLNYYNDYLNYFFYFEEKNPKINLYLKNICIYFIWRYFLKGIYDGDVLSKLKFMAFSIIIIKYLFYCFWQKNNKLDIEDCIEIVRKYSEEIEYCEENINKFSEDSYIIDYFSTENFLKLFNN